MNVQLPVHMDKVAFVDWLQGREEPYELVDGRVVKMVRPSRAHAMIVSNLIVTLRRQLDPQLWTVIAEFGVDTGPKSLRFPDVMVDRAGGGRGDLTASAPALLVEVLSSSTARIDLGDKAFEFQRIPALAAYLVLAQDEQKAWTWIRMPENHLFGPDVTKGEDAAIRIPALGLELSLSEIYAGITFD